MISEYQLGLAFPLAQATDRLRHWYPALVNAMRTYGITNENRITYFLANVAEETAQLQVKEENLNYSGERLIAVFPGMFSAIPQKAHELARLGPEAIANYIYADAHRPPGYRMGNVRPGDGWRFRGRGPMQITGRSNYCRFFKVVGLPDDSDPDLLLQPFYGAMSAAEYWSRVGCNELADRGEFVQCVIKVNGGTTGLASRKAYLRRLQEALRHPDPTQLGARPSMLATTQAPAEHATPPELEAIGSLGAELGSVPTLNTIPPHGYEVTKAGNVVRSNLSESAILKSAQVGQRIAWGTGVVTGMLTGLQALKEAFVGAFSEISPALLLGLSAIAVVFAIATFFYFRSIERKRVEMHRKGIA